MMRCDVELVSPLPPEEGLARLRAATDRDDVWSWFGAFGSKPVVGVVSERSIRLRKRIEYRNSYQTILRGRLARHKAGSMFQGEAGLPRMVVAFMRFWVCGVAPGGGVLSVATTGEMLGLGVGGRRMEGNLPLPLVPVVPILMLAFGAGLVRFGRRLARDEERFLVDFLTKTLEAKAGPCGDDLD